MPVDMKSLQKHFNIGGANAHITDVDARKKMGGQVLSTPVKTGNGGGLPKPPGTYTPSKGVSP